MNNALFHTTCAALLAVTIGSMSTNDAPADWMPIEYGNDNGKQSCIVHTDNIVSVHPVFDADTLMSRKPVALYLDVYLANGRRLTIYEDYEDFKKKITRHNR